MSSSETEVSQKYIHTFHLNFNDLVDTIKDSTHLSILLSKLSMKVSAHPTILSKNMFYEINNQFLFHFNENFDLYLTINDLVETDYFFSINWKISFSPTLELLYPSYCVYKNKLFISISLHNLKHDKAFFVLSYTENELKQTLTCFNQQKASLLLETKLLNFYYNILDKYLKTKQQLQSQKESRFISANFETASKYFLHAKICTSMMGEIVSYSQELIQKGSVIIYKNAQNKKCVIQVRKLDVTNNTMKLKFYIYEGTKTNQPNRELKVELYAVNLNDTFVTLTHNFFVKVPQQLIESLSLGKKKLLRKLGNIIEKTFKSNYSINKIGIMERH